MSKIMGLGVGWPELGSEVPYSSYLCYLAQVISPPVLFPHIYNRFDHCPYIIGLS